MIFSNRFLSKFLLLGFCISILAACNEKPTEIAFNLLNDTINIGTVNSTEKTLIVSAQPYKYHVPIFNVGTIFIGNYKEYKAVSMLRFAEIPDTLDYLTSSDIISVTMSMQPLRYTFGDSSANNLSFKVYAINKPWYNTSSWDTLFGNSSTSPNFDYSKILAEYSAPIRLLDSMPKIEMPLDKDLIVNWLKVWSKFKTDSIPIWGLALVPDETSNVIHQFSTMAIGEERPLTTITVIYKDKKGVLDTFLMTSATDASIFKTPLPDNSNITIQGAASYRSDLWFNVSTLPPLAAIHSAQLEVYLDSTQTLVGNYGIDSLLTAELALDSTRSATARQYYAHRESGTNKYLFKSVTSAVEEWNRRDGKGSLIFRYGSMSNEYRKMDRMSFYGVNNSDKTKVPKLRIIYSTRPELKK